MARRKINSVATALIIPGTILVVITLVAFGFVEGLYHVVGKRFVADRVVPEQRLEAAAPLPEQRFTGALPDPGMIVQRNLFASRNGELQRLGERDPLADLEPSSLDIVLMGTITDPAGDHRAIIYDRQANRQDLYQEGDFVQVAFIKQILRGKVVLTVEGRDEMLDIAQARTVAVPPVPVPVPVVTAEQSIGRPVGTAPDDGPEQRPVLRPPAGSPVTLPQTDNPQLLRSIRRP